MTITDKQQKQLAELINEGIYCQSSTINAKKDYIDKLQDWLGSICKDNNEEVPFWVDMLKVHRFVLGPENEVESDEQLYSRSVSYSIQELNTLQSQFFLQKKIDYDKKQICYLRLSLIISILSVIAVSYVPVYVAKCCTSTIKIDNDQFNRIERGFSFDEKKQNTIDSTCLMVIDDKIFK